MLTIEEKTLIVQCVDAVRAGLDGFKSRTSQQKMITAVASTFGNHRDENTPSSDGRNLLVVESPTGTGKTIAAVIPALVLAKSRKKKLVYSSSTVALQDQLRVKDLPLLRQLLPIDFTYTVAKGRGRYVCASKLFELTGNGKQQRIDLSSDATDAAVSVGTAAKLAESAIDQLDPIAQSLRAGDWNGDRDDMTVSVPDETWSRIITDRQGCGGSKCPYFASCPFYQARLSVKDSDVVIVNHNLALAALDMEPGSVLPDPADTIYVVDECHTLYNKVVDRFSAKHTLLGAVDWLKDALVGAHAVLIKKVVQSSRGRGDLIVDVGVEPGLSRFKYRSPHDDIDVAPLQLGRFAMFQPGRINGDRMDRRRGLSRDLGSRRLLHSCRSSALPIQFLANCPRSAPNSGGGDAFVDGQDFL